MAVSYITASRLSPSHQAHSSHHLSPNHLPQSSQTSSQHWLQSRNWAESPFCGADRIKTHNDDSSCRHKKSLIIRPFVGMAGTQVAGSASRTDRFHVSRCLQDTSRILCPSHFKPFIPEGPFKVWDLPAWRYMPFRSGLIDCVLCAHSGIQSVSYTPGATECLCASSACRHGSRCTNTCCIGLE